MRYLRDAVIGVSVALAGQAVARGYTYDAGDFATTMVSYRQGSGVSRYYNVPANALGRPTVDTAADPNVAGMNSPVPVVPIYAAYQASELVSIGAIPSTDPTHTLYGQLVLGFAQPVVHDPANPYGRDLIVFGPPLASLAPLALPLRVYIANIKGHVLRVNREWQPDKHQVCYL